ncbi:insulinase family protein [Ostreibacterium oceani]|uniref:Protease 3 n=1 Tax=Ostreibacterium oceani TaxID=2654998 RepID=A0A6N7EW24_9GAMM|nr:insulinase family protein [Ostreibacterium oceani]MPV86964.1 hypothetical protein [Ostreibacterium oceani]
MQRLKPHLLTGILMLLSTFSQAENTAAVTKSENDTRHYHAMVLANGFKLLLISDENAQRAAAAVDVAVGSGDDPSDFPGLAHFLEHMLFLGTDQYPDADDYIQFVSAHGGNHNAYTAFNRTNYFFDIDPDHLHDGLKRFSRFFVAPRMDAAYVDRERNAVDSEYQSKLKEDGWRKLDVFKQATNPASSYSRFNIGNNDTLPSETVRSALLDFYKQHYHAENMAGVIIGRQDIATLKAWGEALFKDVPTAPEAASEAVSEIASQTNKSTSKTDNSNQAPSLFVAKTLPLMLRSQSVRDEKRLTINFALPYDASNDYSKSLQYISHVIGYEGQHSLLSALKTAGYATELYAGTGQRVNDEVIYEIGAKLTSQGASHPEQVLAIIFSYLDLLRQDTAGAKRYQELATVAKTNFLYQEKSDSIDMVSTAAQRLNRYPVQDVLAIQSIFTGYDREQITRYLAQMVPQKMVVHLSSPDFKSDDKTYYFSVPYQKKSFDLSAFETAVADLPTIAMALPKPNPFIAEKYALNAEKHVSQHEKRASGVEFYYRHDASFNVPRASVQVSLQPQLTLDDRQKTLMALLANVIDEQLTETLYDAAIAGLYGEIRAGETTIGVSLDGYDAKMALLLSDIIQALKTTPIQADVFMRVKAEYRRELTNALRKRPYEQTFTQQNARLMTHSSLPQARLAQIEQVTLQDVEQFRAEFFKSLAVRMLVYGNKTHVQSVAMAEKIETMLAEANLQSAWQKNSAVPLTDSETLTIKVPHNDHAISYFIQSDVGYQARAEAALLVKLLEADFFTQLRTEKQLGYIVFAYPRPIVDRAGIGFTIQSPVASATELQQHIKTFYQAFMPSLEKLTPAQFNNSRQLLKTELQQKPENLHAAASQYWRDIITSDKTENSQYAIAEALDSLELPTFVSRMQTRFGETGKRLVILAEPEETAMKTESSQKTGSSATQ